MVQVKKWKSFGWEGSLALLGALALGAFGLAASCDGDKTSALHPGGIAGAGGFTTVTGAGGAFGAGDDLIATAAQSLLNGRATFRFDTFGDEAFWGDTLKLHQAIAGSANGGVGAGVSPKTALGGRAQGRRRRAARRRRRGIKAGTVDLDDPATTLALLKLNAVVGVTGFFDSDGGLQSMGIQCALCHSTVDDSFAPGIGKRLRRLAEPRSQRRRDHRAGARSVAVREPPAASTRRRCGPCWPGGGPGSSTPSCILDGKGFRPDGKTAATLIPPAFGLAGVNLHTYTGWGSVTHWNAFVANLEMHGKGTFFDPRLDDATRSSRSPRVRRLRARDQRRPTSISAASSPALHVYQLALRRRRRRPAASTRTPPSAARRCSTARPSAPGCHVAADVHRAGLDHAHRRRDRHRRLPGQALARRALPHDAAARALHATQKGGFYHDGRFATLADVVEPLRHVLRPELRRARRAISSST